MTEIGHLEAELKRLRAKLTVHGISKYAIYLGFIASGIACVWLILTRLFPILGNPIVMGGVLLGAAVISAIIWGFRNRPDISSVAVIADERLGYKERITTTIELKDSPSPFVQATNRDLFKRLTGIELTSHFRFTFDKKMRYAFAPMLAFGALYMWFPEYDLTHYREKVYAERVEAEDRLAHAEELKAIANLVAKTDREKMPEAAKVAEELAKIAEDLKTNKITSMEALARVSNHGDDIRKALEKQEKKTLPPQMSSDASNLNHTREFAKKMDEGKTAEAAKSLESLAEKLRNGEMSAEDRAKLSEEFKQLAANLSASDSEINKELAKALENAAKALESGDPNKAAEALKQAQTSLKDLESAMKQLEQLQQAMNDLDQWKQGMLGPSKACRQCGKKLAQCKKGDKNCKQCKEGYQCAGECAQCAAAAKKKGGGVAVNGKGNGQGPGMKGEGKGQGGKVGDLPLGEVDFKPTVLKGPVKKSAPLAIVLERTAPAAQGERHDNVSVPQAFVRVQQENEQALAKEEIPPGSKELIRKYFTSLEPASDDQNR